MPDRAPALADAARRALGVRRLAFSIHDASFPAGEDDLGRGSPHSEAACSLLAFAAGLGFDVLQLGPQGETGEHDASPYGGAAFSRSILSIAAAALADEEAGELLSRADLRGARAARPEASTLRADHAFAWRAQRALLERAWRALRDRTGSLRARWDERAAAFDRANGAWLARDGLYELLRARHGGRGFRDWPDPDRRLLHPRPAERRAFARRRAGLERTHRGVLELHRFVQLVAREQHAALRRGLAELGMRVYGDLQIGLADRDAWAFDPLFLEDYRLGAPPSRTNPAGQPWGFRVFDPDGIAGPGGRGPVARLVRDRAERVFEAYDGVRIDHPHGLVCPWLYRADRADAQRAVRDGARLFSAAGVPGHEALAERDIARPDQLDLERAPWDDRRVRDLEPAQVERYAALFGELVAAAERAGAGSQALVCEVLSTLPLPLGRVLERFGLGRFRVTGKIDPADPDDPYRIEAAQPPDWVMIGSHDTASLWQLLETWSGEQLASRAAYAAGLLEPAPGRRARFAQTLAGDPGLLAQALLAELFASRAENVAVFFTDLLGIAESYNRPGTVSPDNWSLRVPPDFRAHYRARAAAHRALNVPLALALALRARGDAPRGLARALFEEALHLAPVPEALRAGAP